MSMTSTILGRSARRRKPAPPAQARRAPPRPAPASQPEPPAQPRPRAPPAPPPKRANTLRAIVVDPAARSVEEVQLASEPGDMRQGFGTQLAEGAVEEIVGAEAVVESLDLADGQVVLVDALRQSETLETWRFGDDDETIAGPGVIVAYDPEADAYASTAMTADEVRKAVRFDEGR